MLNGPLAPKRRPKQDTEKVMLLAERWQRAAVAMEQWAVKAKECVDFVEGRQWTADQVSTLEAQGRMAMSFNKIAPLYRLMLGFRSNSSTDIKFLPASDGLGTTQLAEALTHVEKSTADADQLDYIDGEVFADGIMTGRGFYDTRLSFEENDFGDVVTKAVDPFTVYLDPDADKYDMNESNGFQVSRWISLDEIEGTFGKEVAAMLKPFAQGETWAAFPFDDLSGHIGQEITPIRTFGHDQDPEHEGFRDLFHNHFVDTYRKSFRLIDSQYWVSEVRDVFVDLETGDRAVIPSPEEFTAIGKDRAQFIAKAQYHAQRLGNPLEVSRRPVKRARWTVNIGDIIVYDEWSPYDSFTLSGYFPYFRRGYTRGALDDLIDPQRDLNKKRVAQVEAAGRMGNPIWVYEDDSLSPEQERNLEEFGSMPGFKLKYKTGKQAPVREEGIKASQMLDRLEQRDRDDLREISGINESATGELDRVQSGRALEARQRQALIAVQLYFDNFSRAKHLLGKKRLALYQKHYTEERIFRILGEDGKQVETIINQRQLDPVTGQWSKLNDITLGKYLVSIDETPMSATFANAQFEEALLLLEKMGPVGEAMMATRPDLLTEMSSLPRKEEWAEALKQALALANPGGGAPVGPGTPVDQGVLIDDGAAGAGNVVQLPAAG